MQVDAAPAISPGSAPMMPARYRVTARREDDEDGTMTFSLRPVDDPLPPGKPGQFHMIWVFGVGEVPISISDLDGADGVDHTVRSVGAVTRALCSLQPGAMVGVRGPFGNGFDLAAAEGKDLVLIGGGIGLAPLRPVILAAARERERFSSTRVLVGARRPHAVLFADSFDSWRAAGVDVRVTVDAATPGWSGEVGVVTKLIRRAVTDPGTAVAMACGPEVMMRLAAARLIDIGVPAESIQVSLERNMHCAVGLCGRCQLGPEFLCHDGPVFPWSRVEDLLAVRER